MIVLIAVSLAGLGQWGSRRWLRSSTTDARAENRPEYAKFQHRTWKHPREAFDLEAAIIPADEIHSPNLRRDDIPALTSPEYVSAAEADFMQPDESVIGIELSGDARAYPLRVMDAHEAVNDLVGRVPVAVTYCPLCDSSVVFDRRVDGQTFEFGISGLLYNSNVMLYDRQQNEPVSLWSQLMNQAVSGPAVGSQLQTLPVEVTTWADWRSRHPNCRVLLTGAPDGGRPYENYFSLPDLMFPVNHSDERLPVKARVLGVWTAAGTRAYPLSEFATDGAPHELSDQLGDQKFALVYDPKAVSLRIVDADEGVNWMYAFWFAWSAFHPETEVYCTAPAS